MSDAGNPQRWNTRLLSAAVGAGIWALASAVDGLVHTFVNRQQIAARANVFSGQSTSGDMRLDPETLTFVSSGGNEAVQAETVSQHVIVFQGALLGWMNEHPAFWSAFHFIPAVATLILVGLFAFAVTRWLRGVGSPVAVAAGFAAVALLPWLVNSVAFIGAIRFDAGLWAFRFKLHALVVGVVLISAWLGHRQGSRKSAVFGVSG